MAQNAPTPEPNSSVLAPAKLTLSLRVTGVRDDGYHEIESEMVTVDLFDELTFTEGGSGLTIEGGGPDVVDNPQNLVNRAMMFVGRHAHVHLTKRIPSQAGLGGGSADAGAVLRWAGWTDIEAAAKLGADVPFCVVGGRAKVSGIGERVEPLPFVSKTITLFTSDIECSTPVVYQMWDDLGGPVGPWANDLEPAALRVAPELVAFRDWVGEETGEQPHLAGSGSTWFVYGSFPGAGRIVVKTVRSNL